MKKIFYEWDDVDWETEYNQDIAKRKGCHVNAVQYQRFCRAPHTRSLKRPRPRLVDWETRDIDWRKSTKELAAELGLSTATVNIARNIHAPVTPSGRLGSPRYDWRSVDWSKSTSELVRQTGQSQPAVSHARRTHAPDTIGTVYHRYDWSSVDWKSESDVTIAKRLGASRSAVFEARKRRAPETVGLAQKRRAPETVGLAQKRRKTKLKAVTHFGYWDDDPPQDEY